MKSKWGELKKKTVFLPVTSHHVNTNTNLRRSANANQMENAQWNSENLFPSESEKSNENQYVNEEVEEYKTHEDQPDDEQIQEDMNISPEMYIPEIYNEPETMEISLGNNDEQEIYESCLRGYELKKYLGRGGYGSVAKACLKDNCNYAVKLMRSSKVNANELNAIKELSERGIGAKFIDAWECGAGDIPDSPFDLKPVTLIVSEKWDGELPPNVCLDERILLKLCKEIKTLHELGYVHGDILEKNILIKKRKSKIIDATLSDFGFVNTIRWWQTTDKFGSPGNAIETFYKYYKDSGLTDYFRDNDITLADVQYNPTYLDKALMWKLWKVCTGVGRSC